MIRESSSNSRNDLFTASWVPAIPPPKSLPATPRERSVDRDRIRSRPSPLNLSRSSSTKRSSLPLSNNNEPLSPLHQSPSLTASSSWKPPLPPTEEFELRSHQSPTYLLGEGRYARVYLSSYRKGKGKEKAVDLDPQLDPLGQINPEGDGFVGGNWVLCAAKRMNPDREAQTMGLREAFFLNRLKSSEKKHYIIKLLGVREDSPPSIEKRTGGATAHGRSTSDVKAVLCRRRSATEQLSTFPSLPSLNSHMIGKDTPAVSRLTLLLEHAALGTMDRLLRTSPDLVGKGMWAKWARQSTEAVSWIHERGIVHADIKPANLLLTASLDIRLSDFGSSLLIHSRHPPIDGVGLGTLPFSPPELVDPSRSFSFPVDIFALGATLYQCITGKEPFRGLRAVEILRHVKVGGLWEYEERERMNRIGNYHDSFNNNNNLNNNNNNNNMFDISPYPSAWREEVNVKRGGSLRVPSSITQDGSQSRSQPHSQFQSGGNRPRLHRMASGESLKASDDAQTAESPSGIKLWAKWVNRSLPDNDAISALLSEDGLMMPAFIPPSPLMLSPQVGQPPPMDEIMRYLDGEEKVSDEIREALRQMLSPDPDERPEASEVKIYWSSLL